MVCRIERFLFIVAVIWCIQCWLPMAPLALAPLGDIFLLASLLVSIRWLIRGLMTSKEEQMMEGG